MKQKTIIISALLTIAMSGAAQTEVTSGIMYGKKYGVTYMLPQTEIAVTATATKAQYTPGRFCKYAERYLQIKGVRQEADEFWTLDKVTANAVGVPDKENIYFVEMKDKTTAPLMELTKDGIVRSINMPFSGDKASTAVTAAKQAEKEIDPNTLLTEEILMAGSTAKMAELVAKEIFNLRESKKDLISGNADNMPKDGTQLRIMLDNLESQEKALTQMFIGKTQTENFEKTYSFQPKEVENETVCRFSKKLGFVDIDDFAGEAVTISIKDKNIVEPQQPEDAQKKELTGVAYNVPGKADVRLEYQHKTLFNQEMNITQFGSKEYLAPQLFNRNTVTMVLFDTDSGALLKIDRANE